MSGDAEGEHQHPSPEKGDRGLTGLPGLPGETGKRGRRGTMPIQQLGVYLLIVAVAVFGLYTFQKQNNAIRETALIAKSLNVEQNAALCQRGIENREALRRLTQDIAMLIRDLLNTPGDDPNSVERMAALEQELSEFEQQQLTNLPEFTCPEAVPVE